MLLFLEELFFEEVFFEVAFFVAAFFVVSAFSATFFVVFLAAVFFLGAALVSGAAKELFLFLATILARQRIVTQCWESTIGNTKEEEEALPVGGGSEEIE